MSTANLGTTSPGQATSGLVAQARQLPNSTWLIIAVMAFTPVVAQLPAILGISGGSLHVINLVLVYAIEASAVQFLFGMTGSLSVAHSALGAVAGYAFVIMTQRNDVGSGWAVLSGVGLVVVAAILLGAPTLRLSGRYFIITTFAFSQLGVVVAANWRSVTNGDTGVVSSGIVDLGFTELITRRNWFHALLIVIAVTVIVGVLIKRSTFGRRLLALRENAELARSMGINVPRSRLIAFAVSGVIVAVGGMIMASYQQYVSPASLDSIAGMQLVMIVLIGGSRYVLGPLVGSVIVIWLPSVLGLSPTQNQILLGAIFIVVILTFPRGILGVFASIITRIAHRGEAQVTDVPTSVVPTSSTGEQASPTVHRAESPRSVVLRAVDVDRRFAGVHALNAVNFEIGERETVGLIGPNGSGKTTLINVFSGFIAPSAGTVQLAGEDVSRRPAHKRARAGLTRTFQEVMIFPDLTVAEHLRVALDCAHAYRARESGVSWTVSKLADYCRIGHRLDSPGNKLSWGEVRLLGLAMGIAMRPRVLLLDEPFAGLSLSSIDTVAAVIRQMSDDGYSMCVIDHQLNHLLPLCDRVVVFDNGVVVFDGSPPDAMRHDLVLSVYGTEQVRP